MRRILLAVLLLIPLRLPAQVDTSDTRLLARQTVSRNHIAFVCADDRGICDLDGGNVHSLTSDHGVETFLELSPRGGPRLAPYLRRMFLALFIAVG